ncbi:hypothetical protein FS749_015605 [Ceratobasidium sp. UAMH 11750]|nr:hypothetical protein FS749_015605 [Ceratobasidium sp. UAMH 11750]
MFPLYRTSKEGGSSLKHISLLQCTRLHHRFHFVDSGGGWPRCDRPRVASCAPRKCQDSLVSAEVSASFVLQRNLR